jgi:pimeloyl-ACP methyl ester carboxylesterase
MSETLPVVLIPGLACSARMYAPQIPALWPLGPVMVADHTRGDSMTAIAGQILAAAPSRFRLAGLSMGGYVAFEIMRQAPGRVAGLALLDTTARPDAPEQSQRRQAQIALAGEGRYGEALEQLYPLLVHQRRRDDRELHALFRLMADEVGAQAFARQQAAIMGRADSRPMLSAIACPTLVVPDCGHLSTLEAPQAAAAALVSWMRL